MNYPYSQEAKERISALGQAAVVEFIEEIPQELRRIAYNGLPRIQGFRPGSLAELKEKQKRLVGHLLHPQASPQETLDWKSFALLWVAWAKLRFGKTFPESDNPESSLEAGSSFLNRLADHFPSAAREDMERLFKFSGFSDHPDATIALDRFRPALALARERMIDGLPDHLKSIEARLSAAETSATNEAVRIERLESLSASLATTTEDAVSRIDRASVAVAKLQAAMDGELSRFTGIEKAVDALNIASNKLTEAVGAAAIRVDSLEQSLHVFAGRGDRWDKFVVDVAALKSVIASLSEHEVSWTRAAETIVVLEERATALESILTGNGGGSGARQRVRLLENAPEKPFVDILSVKDACSIVSSNLQAVGIVKGEAVATARRIVAALIAGQLIQFSGSLADLVADAVAAAVGGPIYHEWRVPVGLVSDEAASDCVETIVESSRCLLLKGANLSAFEVYGAAIRDIVVRHQFNQHDGYERLALIASWAQGPAVFPDGGTLAELGPVFDTDTIHMRGRATKLPSLNFGRLVKDTWRQIDSLDYDAAMPAAEELGDLLREAGFEGGNLWQRIVNNVYMILRAMPEGNPEGDLQSLLVSWAIPWAKATGGPAKEIADIVKRALAEQRVEAAL